MGGCDKKTGFHLQPILVFLGFGESLLPARKEVCALGPAPQEDQEDSPSIEAGAEVCVARSQWLASVVNLFH